MQNETGTSADIDARPGLYGWMRREGKKPGFVAEQLGIQRQRLARYLRRFDDATRINAPETIIEGALTLTGGAVTALDWLPPRLRPQLADPQPMQAAE